MTAHRDPLRVGVLASGRGSNLQALLDATRGPDFPARVVIAISDRERAQALERAAAAGVEAVFFDPKAYGDLLAGLLALLAIVALSAEWPGALALTWLFNLVGLGDLLLNLGHGVRLQVASQLGAAWFGPAFIVPGMLVIHVLVFVFLVRSKAGAV